MIHHQSIVVDSITGIGVQIQWDLAPIKRSWSGGWGFSVLDKKDTVSVPIISSKAIPYQIIDD
jgi:hypothetical protein